MIDKKILEEKAQKYIVCFDVQCPQHEHCLRWQAGQYVPESYFSVYCVNPNHVWKDGGECIAYRDDRPQRVPVGMVHFYEAMPGAMERAIKSRLIESRRILRGHPSWRHDYYARRGAGNRAYL